MGFSGRVFCWKCIRTCSAQLPDLFTLPAALSSLFGLTLVWVQRLFSLVAVVGKFTCSAGLVHYAKLQYDCGNYTLSGELLKHYRRMISQDS